MHHFAERQDPLVRRDARAYEGREILGLAVTVLVRGETVVRDREFVAESAHGQFVPATPLWYVLGAG